MSNNSVEAILTTSDSNFSLANHSGHDVSLPPQLPYTFDAAESSVMLLVLGAVSLSAVLANLLIIATIRRHRVYHTAGYAFLVSLSISETMSLLVRVFLALPTSVLVQYQPQYHISSDYLRWIGEVLVVSSVAQIPHLSCIAINRYCSVLHYATYNHAFRRTTTGIIITACWAFSITFLITRLLSGKAQYVYSPKLITWIPEGEWSSELNILVNACQYATCLVSIYCYTAVVIRMRSVALVRHSRNPTSSSVTTGQQRTGDPATAGVTTHQEVDKKKSAVQSKDESRLSVQFGVITLVYVLTMIVSSIIWFAIPRQGLSGSHKKVANVVYNLAWTMNYSVNAFVYLVFNVRLRRDVRSFISRRHVIAPGSITMSQY